MTTATLTAPNTALPACPKCEAPAKHALERRNANGDLVGMRYQCSGFECDHVWNDPPLPKVEDAPKVTRHPFGATFAMPQPTRLDTITAPRAKAQRYHPVAPKPQRGPKAAKPKRALPERVCDRCSQPYQPKRATARHCPTCSAQKAHPPTLTERPCDHCGKPYTPKKSTNRFCSRECQVQARIRRKSEARGPRPLCLNCQQPFRRRAVDHVYCSPACKPKKRVVRAQLSLTERTCERDGCGKPYVPTRTDQRFCSTKCLKAAGNDKRATWLTCPQCGGRFKRRTPVHTYCTPACREAAKAAEQSDPGEPVAPTLARNGGQDGTRAVRADGAVGVRVYVADPHAPSAGDKPTDSCLRGRRLALLAELRARYAVRLEAAQAAVDACDVLLALEREGAR